MTSGQRRAAPSTEAPARTRLIDATAQLIAAGGHRAATSRAIADASGENLGAITYYFGSKDELISESLGVVARRMIGPVVAHLTDPNQDPVTKMLGAAQLLTQILQRNEDHLPAYVQSLASAVTDDTVKIEVQRLHRELAAILATEIQDQLAAGSLPGWIEPQPMARLIVALVDGVALSAATDPDETDAAAIAAQFAQLLLAVRTA